MIIPKNKRWPRIVTGFWLTVLIFFAFRTKIDAIASGLREESVPDAPTYQLVQNEIYLPLITDNRAVFYVAPTGNDGNPGSFQAPWKTLQFATDQAPEGSTVYIRGGIYTGFDVQRDHIRFISYPGEQAILEGDGDQQSTLKIANANDILIKGLIVRDNSLQYGTGIKVENSTSVILRNNQLQDNQGFGIVLKDVADVLVEGNRASHNGNGIEIRYGSANVVIRNNQIYDNERRVDSGRAAIGVTFYRTSGPIIAEGNQLWGNHTIGLPDPEGVAFEVYAASNITITGNSMWDNETVLETGTDEAKTPCDRITFTRNIAYRIQRQQGLILRCASNSLFAHNTFDGLDKFAFNLSHFSGNYGASIEGLRIVNNLVVNGRVYSIDTAMPQSVQIDYNLIHNPGSSSNYGEYLAYVEGHGNTKSLAEFQAWTGYDTHGIDADPRLVDHAGRNYHLQAGSPAIDHGLSLGEPYIGLGPDIGRYEFILP